MNNIFRKIKNGVERFIYALPFGLKAANEEVMTATKVDGVEATMDVSDQRVAKHMLKGELTQEVKDLRYRTYKVANESKKFQYIGNGVSVKRDVEKINDSKFKFSQECKIICSDILTELKHINDYGDETYTLSISYMYPGVKFKLEQFATQIDVYVEDDFYETTLHFNSIANAYDKKSMPFINTLKKLQKDINEAKEKGLSLDVLLAKEEITSSMITLSFITFNATNDYPDMVSFTFTEPQLTSINMSNSEFRLSFRWKTMKKDDLMEKVYSENMENKYKNHERKNVQLDIVNKERVRYCSVCGKKINVYDGDLTEYDSGKALCIDCFKKEMLNKL